MLTFEDDFVTFEDDFETMFPPELYLSPHQITSTESSSLDDPNSIMWFMEEITEAHLDCTYALIHGS